MSRIPESVLDLVASQAISKQSVQERIQQRVDILEAWLKEGIPPGKEIPSSLVKAREWTDEELGIQKISSPNEFTRTHPQHGNLVKKIGVLLERLSTLHARAGKGNATTRSNPAERFDQEEHDRQLQAACSQWHSERARHLTEKKRADTADARSIALLEDNAQKEVLIADLRRQLSSRDGLKAVE